MTQENAALVARAAIRAGDEDLARLAREGWQGWVDWQLGLPHEDSPAVRDALSKVRLRISYEAGDGFKGLKEERPLAALRRGTEDLWHLTNWDVKMAWEERIRPGEELIAATLLRTVVAESQLREAVTDFWRDHFSVNREASEDVQIALPAFDQDVLRQHALGNFRTLLEAVAKSTAMLAYLNNASSRASPANENYARELLELHSLGAGAYFNDKFDRWREVPGALEGVASGYIDEDVYEAARAFTGWSYETGQDVAEGVKLPRSGRFAYVEHWHDPYQKRVLGVEFASHAGPMADGLKVLDQVAFHPATARHVVQRLCQRFVADVPSESLVQGALDVFVAKARAPDQMAQVMRHILLSVDFQTAKPRLQRPLFLLASMQRKVGVLVAPEIETNWLLDQMGQKLYSWHSPAGHPLHSAYWSAPGLLLRRWRGMYQFWTKIMDASPRKNWADVNEFTNEWCGQLGVSLQSAPLVSDVLTKEFGDAGHQPHFAGDERWSLAQGLTLLTATAEFQAV